MSSVFPGSIDDFDTSMLPGGLMNTPSHAAQHQKIGDALEKMQDVMRFGTADAALSASTSAGATSVSLTRGSPLAAQFNKAGVICIGVGFGVTFEARIITSLSSNTFSFSTALLFTHSADEPVWWLRDNKIRGWHFGITAQAAYTPQWQALQRAFVESRISGLKLAQIGAHCDKPIGMPGLSAGWEDIGIQFGDATVGGWTGPTSATDWAAQGCDFFLSVTSADPSTDRIFAAYAGDYPRVGLPVMLNNPNGGSLPGGLTAGKRYWCKSTDGSTYFVLSDRADLSTTVHVTSTGTGYVYSGFGSQSKYDIENLNIIAYPSSGAAFPNILSLSHQQSTPIRKLQVRGGRDVQATRWLMELQGQGGNYFDVNISAQDFKGWRTIDIHDATLMTFEGRFFADTGKFDGSGPPLADDGVTPIPAGRLRTSWSITWPAGLWSEQGGNFEVQAGSYGIDFGPVYGTPTGGIAGGIVDTSGGDSSYTADSFRGEFNGRSFYKDTTSGLNLVDATSGAGAVGDGAHGARGIVKFAQQPPMIRNRRKQFVGTSFQVTLDTEFYVCHTDGSHQAITGTWNVSDIIDEFAWQFQHDPGSGGAGAQTVTLACTAGTHFVDPTGASAATFTIGATDFGLYTAYARAGTLYILKAADT